MSLNITAGAAASKIISHGIAKYQANTPQSDSRSVDSESAFNSITALSGFANLFDFNSAGNSDGNVLTFKIQNLSTGLVCPRANIHHYSDVNTATGGYPLLNPGDSTKYDFTGDLNGDGNPYCGVIFDVFDKDGQLISGVTVTFGSDDNRNYFPLYSISDGANTQYFTDIYAYRLLHCAVINDKFSVAMMGTMKCSSASAWVANIIITDV